MDTPINRLLSYAQVSDMIVSSEQCRAIFNDFQTMLSTCENLPKCGMHDKWSPEFEDLLVSVRNLINLTGDVWLNDETKGE